MLLEELVAVSRRVGEVGGRNEKIGLLAELLRRLAPEEVRIAVAFLSGAVRQGRIGIGYASIQRALPGRAAEAATLALAEVDEALARIAGLSGARSTAGRAELLRALLLRGTAPEQDFLVRLLFGELRQGALEGVLAEAVARASDIAAPRIRRAAMLAGDLGGVAAAVLTSGEAGLAPFTIELFRPVQPMLASPSADLTEALERLPEALLEAKLDGARIQVHKAGAVVKVYTRGLREVTGAVPEVVAAALALPARELIADGEAIALRPDGAPHTFQTTMRRFGRKLESEELRRQLPLSPFLFDLLYLDGQALLDEPLSRRRDALAGLAPSLLVPSLVTGSHERAEAFFEETLRRGHEGVMAKALEAPYEAGSRGFSWLKVKPAHTLDLVVLAAEWGHGRRRGWLSNLHLGARDTERGGFVMLGKTFKGLTDELLAWQTERFLSLEIGRDEMTVYVRPEQVVEIAFNDLQESPHYPGGLALRFARVKRYRGDKPASEADTFETVRHVYSRATGLEPPPRR